MKKLFFVLLIIAAAVGWFALSDNKNPANEKGTRHGLDKSANSLSNPASIWVVVNKQHPLRPANYRPADLVAPAVALRLNAQHDEMLLRRRAASALEKLFAGAEKNGLSLMLASAFRSYSYQEGLYNTYVQRQGQALADTQSARPGYSEHQTGLAADVEPASRECEVAPCFADLPEGKWVAAHAHEFGFIVRYPENKDAVTGYIYEPWHLRYVGEELAQTIHAQGNPTLEDFFNLPPAANYQ